MKCSVIRDLMPLYIDEVCGEDTVGVVEEHLAGCEDCRRILEKMRREPELPALSEEEKKMVKSPFQVLLWRKRNQIITAVAATAVCLFSVYALVSEVEWLNHIFFPCIISYVDAAEDDWQPVTFRYDEQSFSPYGGSETMPERLEVPGYGFVRWKGQVTNSAHNGGVVFLRIRDQEGNAIADEIRISPGEGVLLEQFKKGKNYYVEIKAEKEGIYRMAFS